MSLRWWLCVYAFLHTCICLTGGGKSYFLEAVAALCGLPKDAAHYPPNCLFQGTPEQLRTLLLDKITCSIPELEAAAPEVPGRLVDEFLQDLSDTIPVRVSFNTFSDVMKMERSEPGKALFARILYK